ncbi:unnamed protein product [Didymodactylos carnosus]|uniref:Hedgehog protein Hint domain-containing protein n=1 Tax=Didymodactylos carnosus TaxID=1234261 RepID=A0A8S2ECU2_9BILA|nr:unnamed protein product [Didymodactylos carnosus]CAF3896041.1 unnamed protein product [Didymodactylos carnosus]
MTREGNVTELSNLKVGDQVLSVDNGQNLIFEPILGFIHAEPNGFYDFLSIFITAPCNDTIVLSVTSNHLIFLYKNAYPIFAGKVRVGDDLQIVVNEKLSYGKVVDVKLRKSEGFYAPLTSTGKIVIDNVLASNYADVKNHYLAHIAMKPYKWWLQMFGLTSHNINWYIRSLQLFAEKWLGSIMYDGTFEISGFM